ncbi:MAG: hypothetical protein WD273_01125 [Trueperaceae bacterium]
MAWARAPLPGCGKRLGSNWTFLDLTPLGRQEEWEDSPEGWHFGTPLF